jgi:hypothetical protein
VFILEIIKNLIDKNFAQNIIIGGMPLKFMIIKIILIRGNINFFIFLFMCFISFNVIKKEIKYKYMNIMRVLIDLILTITSHLLLFIDESAKILIIDLFLDKFNVGEIRVIKNIKLRKIKL